MKELKSFFQRTQDNNDDGDGIWTFIVKPESLCQGKGIYIVRDLDSINPCESYVVQKYIHNPLLIDGLKFDLWIYVLVVGIDPLRIFIFKDGLVWFATVPY